jgi:hypothetical protein
MFDPNMPTSHVGRISEDGRWRWDGHEWKSTLSEDGRWRWDGQAWQPVAAAPGLVTPATKQSHKVLWAVIIGAILFVGICTVAVARAPGSQQGASDGAAAANRAGTGTVTPQWPTANQPSTPTPGLSQHDLRVRYAKVTSQDSANLVNALSSITSSCGSGNTILCRGAVQRNLDQTNNFLADLDRTPPPDCLKDTDAQLRLALNTFKSGEQQIITGIDQNNAAMVNQGSALIVQANGQIDRTNTLIERANCP